MTKDSPNKAYRGPELCIYNTEDEEKFKSTLLEILRMSDGIIPQKDPKDMQIFTYLTRYLKTTTNGGFDVKTIICENEYICLNFLEDYANYYSKTYSDYRKKCKRIHFFTKDLIKDSTNEDIKNSFLSEIIGENNSELNNCYVGCIVVKPIPKGIFGITYLRTYTHEEVNRHYKCVTNNKINLFGLELEVNTMPFKQQDGAVASCATTALWMAFNKTAELFHTAKPSLSEITMLAGPDSSGKIFPSKKLESTQICNAISKLGMIPDLNSSFKNTSEFKSKLHAYLRCEIPILLCVDAFDSDEFVHLITINGYKYNESISAKLLSDTIELFYSNDDQVGPFTRTRIGESQIRSIKRVEIKVENETSTQFTEEEIGKIIIFQDMNYIVIAFKNKIIFADAISKLGKDEPDIKIEVNDDEYFYIKFVVNNDTNKNKIDFIINNDKYKIIEDKSFDMPIALSIRWPKYDRIDACTGACITGYRVVKPNFVVVPLLPSIRVVFEDIYLYYLGISNYITELQKKDNESPVADTFVYDIYLTRSNNYKKELIDICKRNSVGLDESKRKSIESILLSSLPKYIWIIRALNPRDSNDIIFDFIYDTVENRIDGLPINNLILDNELSKIIKDNTDIANDFSLNYTDFKESDLCKSIKSAEMNQKLVFSKKEFVKKVTEEGEEKSKTKTTLNNRTKKPKSTENE